MHANENILSISPESCATACGHRNTTHYTHSPAIAFQQRQQHAHASRFQTHNLYLIYVASTAKSSWNVYSCSRAPTPTPPRDRVVLGVQWYIYARARLAARRAAAVAPLLEAPKQWVECPPLYTYVRTITDDVRPPARWRPYGTSLEGFYVQ